MELKPYTVLAGVAVIAATVSAGFQVAQNLDSSRRLDGRSKALAQIVNYRKAGKCEHIEGAVPLIGQTFVFDTPGLSDTECFYHKSGRYIYVGYLNGQLTARYIFTKTEVNNGVKQHG